MHVCAHTCMDVYECVHAGMHVCRHACVGKAREKIPVTPVSSNQCSQGCRIGSMLQAHWLEPQVASQELLRSTLLVTRLVGTCTYLHH